LRSSALILSAFAFGSGLAHANPMAKPTGPGHQPPVAHHPKSPPKPPIILVRPGQYPSALVARPLVAGAPPAPSPAAPVALGIGGVNPYYAGELSPRAIQTAPAGPAFRPVRPLSVVPVDPNAVVARTSSGRIFIGPAPGAYIASPHALAHYKRLQNPYAPPSFQMLGAPAGSHMGQSVGLTYGVQPSRRFNPGPKVVWLDEKGRGQTTAVEDDENPHIRHMPRHTK
jgi:hypothetical protein